MYATWTGLHTDGNADDGRKRKDVEKSVDVSYKAVFFKGRYGGDF